jgi:hypothetical protein
VQEPLSADDLRWGGAVAVPSAAELAEHRAAAAAALRPTDSGFCAAYSTAYLDALQGGASAGAQLEALAARPLPLDADTGAFGSDPGPAAAGASQGSDPTIALRAAAANQQVEPCTVHPCPTQLLYCRKPEEWCQAMKSNLHEWSPAAWTAASAAWTDSDSLMLQATLRNNLTIEQEVAAFEALNVKDEWRKHRACRITASIQALDSSWRCLLTYTPSVLWSCLPTSPLQHVCT